ncbi:cadmium-translocating P-type ATPase [Saccharibacter sp. 17.LH.SD]|uniref:heavy metal translocating P-type ATPase n=1 Tax=Saccharibacter sp. 17.LH.SD TaxID=2689393 RepID=UPI00136DA038|nr:heavy metal translocating P-type ATPase [Saccharibacter sp. 17.LH.SD]MXV45006.1 cadmium-translocating P-type ATPase [Saccharibacter sp. 17.LH.SD]
MSCASCSSRIERVLNKLPGVASARVNLATETAYIDATDTLDPQQLVSTIKQIGFEVPENTVDLDISGMSCASCSARIERVLQHTPGVTQATVNLATERATVTGTTPSSALIEAITKSGFSAHISSKNKTSSREARENYHDSERLQLKKDFIIAAILWGLIAIFEMVSPLRHLLGFQGDALIQFGLTTLLLIGPGRRFFQKGVPALLRRAPEMNSLVAVGSFAAYGYSTVATFFPAILPHNTLNLYYEAAAGIITFVLLGRFLEAYAKGRTSAALRKLTHLQARTAHVLRDNTLITLPIEDVVAGDLIEVRPGENIPVDGQIYEGESRVNEAMLTGEAIAVPKKTGDIVIGGTTNQNGSFRFRATAVGHDTMLAHIVTMVEQAQNTKLPIQSLVNTITLWFVPAIMGISTLTFIAWIILGHTISFALINAVSVLIAACPCAMGLATPTAIMVGTGKGAELGILFRKGDALQQLEQTHIVAFDKTGTLTEGTPALTDLFLCSDYDRATLLRFIAAVEARSEHPIARAIVNTAEAESLVLPDISQFEAIPGMGVTAQIDNTSIQVGSARYMHSLGIDLSSVEARATSLSQEGKSPLYAALNGTLAALLAVSDPIKPTSHAAIKTLHHIGIKTAMITGDHDETARMIARQLDIDDVIANVLPQGKVEAIKKLQHQNSTLTFVGDGINDAPALAQADIGIAVGRGTDIALETADVILMHDDLNQIATAISLSQATLRNIRQNLFWAFAYNVVLIPIAAGMLYPLWGLLLSPMFAAGAMALSSVFVLGNALRLRYFHAPAS